MAQRLIVINIVAGGTTLARRSTLPAPGLPPLASHANRADLEDMITSLHLKEPKPCSKPSEAQPKRHRPASHTNWN